MPRDRLVTLEGALNFRDLGGYAGDGGRTTRWGRVFRSDALHRLTDADIETLRALGLRAVFDLRQSIERTRQPTVIPASHGHRAVHLVVGPDEVAEAGPPLAQTDSETERWLLDQIVARSLPEPDDGYLVGLYGQFLVGGAPAFGALLTHLADDDGLPALFHCAAGKDRTGIAAALLLSVLGVDEKTILDDYELSNLYRVDRRLDMLRPTIEGAGVDPDTVRPFLSARRPVLATTLDRLRADGGVEAYLLGPAGMQPATLDRLRTLLLE
jgi:protein-tyrosine phosphatase